MMCDPGSGLCVPQLSGDTNHPGFELSDDGASPVADSEQGDPGASTSTGDELGEPSPPGDPAAPGDTEPDVGPGHAGGEGDAGDQGDPAAGDPEPGDAAIPGDPAAGDPEPGDAAIPGDPAAGDPEPGDAVMPGDPAAGDPEPGDAAIPGDPAAGDSEPGDAGDSISPFIDLYGRVVDEAGAPIAGATLLLSSVSAVTAEDGSFLLSYLPRENGLLQIDCAGYRTALIAVHLHLPKQQPSVLLDPIILAPSDAGETRFLFGGDLALGRRYLDPEEETPRDELPPDSSDALILVSDPEPGSRNVLTYMTDLIRSADFAAVNLESPVTRDLSAPHEDKLYVLVTLPESLAALSWLGVDYVSLGNNHVYDYLESGLGDTLANLDNESLSYSGAGTTSEEAFQAHRVTLGGSPYALLSMTSITGDQYEIDYVASPDKGGAANLLDDTAVTSAITGELAAGYTPIVLAHTGNEYSVAPGAEALERFQFVREAGAALVIGHHTHMAQGFEWQDNVLTAYSLGNFALDQERLETHLGILALVDMRGAQLVRVHAIPMLQIGFRPRAIAGALADRLLRRVAEHSGTGVSVFPYLHRGYVVASSEEILESDRVIELPVTLPASEFTVVDLRDHSQPHESLRAVSMAVAGARAQVGRDVMLFGDFEDYTIDDEATASAHWLLGAAGALETEDPYRGSGALCSYRTADNSQASLIRFRFRARVMGEAVPLPQKSVSLVTYQFAENAGASRTVASYLSSEGPTVHGTETVLQRAATTHGWQLAFADLTIPAEAEEGTEPPAINLSLYHEPPESGEGRLCHDELALVSWEETLDIEQGATLETPHARDFLRIQAPAGNYTITLRFRSTRPQAAAGN